MKEFKFRAWDEKNKCFYYSGISCDVNEYGHMFSGDRSCHPDFFDGWGVNNNYRSLDIEQYIDKELVMKLCRLEYEPGLSSWWIVLNDILKEYGYIFSDEEKDNE
jgi:hypothetical protein